MPFLKLFSVWDSFKEDGIVCHIFAPRKRAFSRPYPVVFGFGAKIFLPPRRVYGVSFSTKIWFMNLGLRFLWVLKISVASNCKFLWWMDTVFAFVNNSSKFEQLSLFPTILSSKFGRKFSCGTMKDFVSGVISSFKHQAMVGADFWVIF